MYVIVEAVVLGILGGVGGTAADARIFFMGHNVIAILSANRIGDVDFFNFSPRDTSPMDLPDPALAALVMALYCLAFLAIAFWIFQRRDIRA